MRKTPKVLSDEEKSALLRDLRTRFDLTTKKLMRKYGASRSLIDTVSREAKLLASRESSLSAYTSVRVVAETPARNA